MMAGRFRNVSVALILGIALAGLGLAPAPADAGDEAAWLGVHLQEVDPELRDAFDLEGDVGVLIAEVVDGSPAEEAGIEDGDIIVEIDDRKATSVRRVVRAVRRADPGDVIEIELLRDGEKKTIEVKLGEHEGIDEEEIIIDIKPHSKMRKFVMPRHGKGLRALRVPGLFELESTLGGPRLGVETRRLDEDLASYFEVDEGEGVLIMEVLDETPAEEVGLKTGDVILALNDTEVNSPGDLRDLVIDNEGETVSLKVKRHGKEMKLDVTLESQKKFWHTEKDFDIFWHDDDEGGASSLKEELEFLREELEELKEELRSLKD